LKQFRQGGTFSEYFKDFWNIGDVFMLSAMIAGVVFEVLYGLNVYRQVNSDGSTDTTYKLINSVVHVSIWLKFLYFLQGFKATGHTLRMIYQSVLDVRAFLFVMFIIVLGFAKAMTSINQENWLLQWRSLLVAAMGGFEVDDYDDQLFEYYLNLLFYAFLLITFVVMFNMLIAIVSQTFEDITENAVGAWRYEQGRLVIESLSADELEADYRIHDWLHILMPSSNDENDSDFVKTELQHLVKETIASREIEKKNFVNIRRLCQDVSNLESRQDKYETKVESQQADFDKKLVSIQSDIQQILELLKKRGDKIAQE
jgi:hypothetical protein